MARGLLHCGAEVVDLGTLLFVGRRDVHRQQVAERIDCHHMHLAASPALVAGVACARSALAARLQRATIERDRARLTLPALGHANDRAQIRDHRFEAVRLHSAAALLVDRLPRWEVVGQQTQRCASTNQLAQGVKDFAQVMAALRRRLFHQRQIRASEAQFFVADVRRVGLAGHSRALTSLLLRRSKLRKRSKRLILCHGPMK